jgi:hypothetical protein
VTSLKKMNCPNKPFGSAMNPGGAFTASSSARSVLLRAACLWLLAGGAAWAFINPKFTPVQLVKESQLILAGQLRREAGATVPVWEGLEIVKGQFIGQPVLSLVAVPRDQREQVERLFSENHAAPILLFAVADKEGRRAYLHLGGAWLDAKSGDGRRWDVGACNQSMSGVFAGGTDMLGRMTRFLLTGGRADVPVSVGTRWTPERAEVAKGVPEVTGLEAVDLGQGRPLLFLASKAGDRLFRPKPQGEGFDEITKDAALGTTSRQFAWLDLGAGRPGLVSWNGKAIMASTPLAQGQFTQASTYPFEQPCLGLAPCHRPADRIPAVLVSTRGLPLLLCRGTNDAWSAAALPNTQAVALAGPGSGPCVVADLDNDGFFDVLQPRQKGGLLWKGSPSGFLAPILSRVGDASGTCRVAVGDFNQDGFLDLFVSGKEQNELWENDGQANFRPVILWSGTPGYRCRPGASDCRATDLNGDGRTDLMMFYVEGGFAYHFNRGFRCLGEEGELRLVGGDGVTDDPRGQLAGAVADFNGDGSLDLAVAFADGSLCCFYNEASDCPRVRLRLKPGLPGPLTASLWDETGGRCCFGAQSVINGGAPAWLHLRNGQPHTLQWTQPDRPARTRRIELPTRTPKVALELTVGE